MDDLQYWWNFFMWVLGATIWTLAALHIIQWLAWRVFRELVGWPTLLKILKEHRRRNEGEQP